MKQIGKALSFFLLLLLVSGLIRMPNGADAMDLSDTASVESSVSHGETRIEQADLSVARGQKDDTVASLQRLLIYYGYLPEGADDGIFGKNTEKAVVRFQENNGLWMTGAIDGETYDALYNGVIPDANGGNISVLSWPPDAKRAPRPAPTPAPEEISSDKANAQMVWIPRSGKRYHRRESCSNMKKPKYVTIKEAKRRGFTPCKKCY